MSVPEQRARASLLRTSLAGISLWAHDRCQLLHPIELGLVFPVAL
jgi:hypothetical protein